MSRGSPARATLRDVLMFSVPALALAFGLPSGRARTLTLLAPLPQEAGETNESSLRQRLHEHWDTPEKLFDGLVATAGVGFTAGVAASVGFWLLVRTRRRAS